MRLTWINTNSHPDIVKKCEEEFKRLCEVFPELDGIEVKCTLNTRMRSTAGTANYSSMTVNLNVRLLAANPDHLLQTFVHECCHLFAFKLHGRNIQPHGYEWQRCMIRSGYSPDRCHSLDVSDLKAKRTKYDWSCTGCNATGKVGKKVANKITRGHAYTCRSCRSPIRLGDDVKVVKAPTIKSNTSRRDYARIISNLKK